MEYSVQNLEYAVSVFYNSEQNERIQAHQWLTAAQRCPEAWSFVWELLRADKICTFQGTEVQFFAATTLHTKLLRCWHELPPESYEELQNKIMQTILAYSNGPKIISNRLCISLAAFILQKGASDLVTILRPLSTAENTSLLLEVLTVIPEEFKSMTMGSSLRVKNRIALQQACPAVLDDMLRYLQIYNKDPPSDETMQSWCSAAMCAASWLSLEGDENSIKDEGSGACLADRLPICQALHNIIQLVFTHNEVISDVSLETCEAALNAIRAAGTTPDAARFPVAAFQLLSAVADLAQPILARDNVPNSINEELLSALATCAVSLAETHTKWIVVGTQQGHAGARMFLELLLATQAAPGHYPIHETRSQLVLSCWYTLQDEILYMKESTGQVHEMWPEVFSRLLGILLLKSEAPSEDSLSREDAELLRCYRQDIADTVMYCNCILGQWSWSLVECAWREATTDSRREAVLHVFATLADASPSQDPPQHIATLLKHVVEVVSTTTDTRLLNTALECLGSYATWLSVIEPEGREIGAAALRAVGSALSRSPAAAALALKKLCTECSELAAPLAEEIVMAIQNDSTASSGGAAGSNTSSGWARVWLYGAAGAALRACHSPRDIALARALSEAARRDMQGADAPLCKRRAGAEAASALLSALTSRGDLASQTFASLLPALPPYARHPALVPSLFLLLKQAISVLMDDCLPLLDQVAELVVQASETQPCASGLDVVKLMVLFYGTEWQGCSALLRTCVSNAARCCATDASSKSDLTEGLFTLLQAITKKRPQYLDALKDIMPELVDLGCGCIRLWEAGAARAACRWLSALCAAQTHALRPRAPSLTAAACSCIGGLTPRNQIEPLAEVLLSLNKATWDDDGSLSVWLREALAVPGFPTHHATDEAKHKFINTVIREKSSKRRLLEAVHEFSLVCRGLVGTEYARQTLPVKQMYIK